MNCWNPLATGSAAGKLLLAGTFRKQVNALNDRNLVPVDHLFLQRPVEGCVLVRGENDSALRVGTVTRGSRTHLIITGGEIFHPVRSVVARKHDHRGVGLGVARFDECRPERRAIRPGYFARDGRAGNNRGNDPHRGQQIQKLKKPEGTHKSTSISHRRKSREDS